MTELVIFDCDGVLVDSEPIAVRVDVEMLAGVGVTMSEAEVIERYVGRSPEVILAETEARLGRRLPEDWFERGEARLRRIYVDELAPIPGIDEALAAIEVPVCVASSSGHSNLRFKLELTGLYERFAGHIFSASEVANGKPAPDLFLHAAARMGASPGGCVVVEDSRYGVQAARAAGMDVLAYAGGLTPAHVLEGERTVVFDDMHELPRLLASREEAAR
jgi:HAD superfamily hydrolase (TIGR01509 family)